MNRLKAIRLIAMDVDGTLTDGTMITTSDGEIKMFNAMDGLGINLALTAGFKIAWITGNLSEAIRRRAHSLRVTDLYLGSSFKSVAIEDLAEKHGIAHEEMAFIGDDLNDLPAFSAVGVSFAVANASSDVKQAADFVTEKFGGHGAVREVIEMILKAQGKWDEGVRSLLDRLREEEYAGEWQGDVN